MVRVGEIVGGSGSGQFTQTGGTNSVGTLTLAQSAGSYGSYDLTGGLLALSSSGISQGAGSASFNFGGGTLGAIAPWSSSVNMTLTGNGGNATVDTTGGNITLSGVLSSSGGLNKTGVGTLTLTGSNTYSGGTAVFDGTLLLGDGATADGYVAGNILDNATLAFAPVAPQSFSGTISGSGAFVKLGGGRLTLATANTYTGGTSIGGGTLALDFSQPGAPTTNILYDPVPPGSLTVGGGVLVIQGSPGTANSQTFSSLVVNPGGSAIVLLSAASDSLVLNLGSITRNEGGTVDFTLPSGAQSATNGITTTTPNANGILGGWATVSGTDWAASSGTAGNIVAYSGYTNGDLGTLASNGTLNVEPSGLQTAVTTSATFNSLNLAGTVGVTMSGSGSLTLTSGGLISNTSGTITGGTLAGSPSGELVVITPQDLAISSAINASVLTKAGSGKLTLLAANNAITAACPPRWTRWAIP